MKDYLIGLSLILLVIHYNYGFTFPRIDLQHPTKLLYKSNDGSELSISDSYVEKPTLKEIIYYHLIEKPYPEGQEEGKTKTEISEDTFDLIEDLDIDPRKDEPVRNSYSTEETKHGIRQKRDTSLERIPTKRAKRTFYKNWGSFTSGPSRIHTQHLADYVRKILTEEKPVKQQDSKYNHFDGRLPNTQVKKNNKVIDDVGSDDELEYLGYDELEDENNSQVDDDEKNKAGVYIESTTIRNNMHFAENSKFSGSSEDDWGDITAWNDDNDSDGSSVSTEDEEIGCEDGEDCDESGEDTNLNFDDILNEIHQILVDENSKINLPPGMIDNPQNVNVLNFVHNVLKGHENSSNQGIITKTKPVQSNFLDALRGLFTNIVKNNIVINNHEPITPKLIDIKPEKDRIKDRENLNKITAKPLIEQNIRYNSSTTESPKGKVTPTVDKINEITNKSKNIGPSKDKDFTPPPLELTTATTIVKNSTVNNKNKSNDTEKQTETDIINTETNTSGDISQSKGNDFLLPLLESTTAAIVKNTTEIDKNKLNDTDKFINLTSTTVSLTTPPMTTESFSIGTEEPTTTEKQEPTTSNPTKITNNATNEKRNGTDEDKKINFMLDLINNENFWKFMGDLGGKYLESLIAHTQSVIKEHIATQIKEHLDALNKYDEKLLEKKEEVKENKPVKDRKENSGEKNRVAKNINETVSIKAHNLYGNTIGNDKVTNVYVFYANEHIDDLIKNIHEIANKTNPANSTNIYTFIPSNLEVNNKTSKLLTTTLSEVSPKLPIKTVSPVAEKPINEQNAKPIKNSSDNKDPNNIDNHSERDSNCDHDKSHCNKMEVSTKPSINTDQGNNIAVHSTEPSTHSTIVSEDQISEVITHIIDLIPDKLQATETANKPTPSTDKISTIEAITANMDLTTESVATKPTSVAQVTSTEVQTEITQYITHSGVTSTANPTTEPVITKVTTTPDTTTASSTESSSITQLTTFDTTTKSTTEKSEGITHQNDDTHTTTTISGGKVTTESMKPDTSNISSATEVTSIVSGTTIESAIEKHNIASNGDDAKVNTGNTKPTTDNIISSTKVTSTIQPTTLDITTGSNKEKNEDVHHQNATTSDIDKVTTESMKPEASDISSTTEITTTAVSETRVESTTEKHYDDDKAKVTSESMKPGTSDIISATEVTSTVSDVISKENKDTVTTEIIKPVLDKISSSTELSSHDIANSTELTNTDPKDITTAKPDTSSTTDSVTDTKLTIETINVSVDEADKNHTILNNESSNSSSGHNEYSSTTESPENKTDSIDSTKSVAEKTTENTKSTNDESKITTEKAESTNVDTEAKQATESTTEKHDEVKS